jgi:hypothetical protein
MMSVARHVLTFFCLGVMLSFQAFGQEVKVELGPDQLGINETFTIKVTLSNEKIKSYDQFPEIPKAGHLPVLLDEHHQWADE